MAEGRYGTYRGVIADIRDPKNLGRIRIRIPQVTGSAITNWSYYSSAPQIKPKVGDRVYVTFIGGDTHYPVWQQIVSTKNVGDWDIINARVVNISSSLVNDGSTTLNGPLNVNTPATFDGATFSDDVFMFQDLNVSGAVTADFVESNGNLEAGGDIIADGANINGLAQVNTLLVDGTGQVSGQLVVNGGILLPANSHVKRGNITGMTMQNGWGYWGGGYQNPAYVEYPDNTAGIMGVASTGTTTSGTTISTLPAAIRPADIHVFTCSANAQEWCQIVIEPGGAVKLQNPTDPGILWVSLSGCHWPINGF